MPTCQQHIFRTFRILSCVSQSVSICARRTSSAAHLVHTVAIVPLTRAAGRVIRYLRLPSLCRYCFQCASTGADFSWGITVRATRSICQGALVPLGRRSSNTVAQWYGTVREVSWYAWECARTIARAIDRIFWGAVAYASRPIGLGRRYTLAALRTFSVWFNHHDALATRVVLQLRFHACITHA